MLRRISNTFRSRNPGAVVKAGVVAGVLLTILAGVTISLTGLGDALARFSYDFPFIFQNRVPEELVMVYVDADVKRRLGENTDRPLSRRYYTQLLERLTKEKARSVLFDILFEESAEDPQVDQQFAAALREHGRVVLVAEDVEQAQANYRFSVPIPPTPMLRDAAAGYGLANVDNDTADQSVRKIYGGSESVPSASWVAATLLEAPVARNPGTRLQARWLNYYCSPAKLRAVNLDEALAPAGLAPGYFTGKLVVIGSRPGTEIRGTSREVFGNPYSRFGDALSPGAVIHGLSVLNLWRGDWLTRLSTVKALWIMTLWGALAAILLLRLPPQYAVGTSLLLLLLWVYTSAYLQLHGHVWFAWAIPAAVQTPVALVWGVAYRYLVESRRRRKLRRAFAAYLSPQMADRIANSNFDLAPGGKEVEATIMFTDLEGFTTMSESLPPADVSRILIAYFNRTTRAILEQDGTVIKFIGDAVLAAWGAPLANPNPAERAVVAAWNMLEVSREEIEGRRLHTRIGVNTGLALAGNLGSDTRFDYTLIGDAINVAARLEPLNKRLGTQILISESTRAGLSERIQVRRLGRFVVAGRTSPIEVYEVLDVEPAVPPPGWRAEFDRALRLLEQADFDAAIAGFEAVARMRNGHDGPSEFFVRLISGLRAKAQPGWDGVVRLEGK